MNVSGAALAFNHLAKILGDHASIVNKFWIELLYNFVRNLSLSSKIHNHPASIAIDHLLKVFQRNQDLFNQVVLINKIEHVPIVIFQVKPVKPSF